MRGLPPHTRVRFVGDRRLSAERVRVLSGFRGTSRTSRARLGTDSSSNPTWFAVSIPSLRQTSHLLRKLFQCRQRPQQPRLPRNRPVTASSWPHTKRTWRKFCKRCVSRCKHSCNSSVDVQDLAKPPTSARTSAPCAMGTHACSSQWTPSRGAAHTGGALWFGDCGAYDSCALARAQASCAHRRR